MRKTKISSNELSKDIAEIVKKNLPAEVGDQLQKTLKEHAEFKEERQGQFDKINSLVKSRDALQKRLDEHAHLGEREASVLKREQVVEKAEIRQELEHTKVLLVAQKVIAEDVKEFMINMSKNTIYRKSFVGEVPAGVVQPTSDPYNMGGPQTVHVDQNTETTEE